MTSPDGRQIENGEDYALFATADLTRYALRHKAEGMIAEISGDDAARFAQDYEEMKLRFPDWNADKLLAQLWDQGGYGWLARQEE